MSRAPSMASFWWTMAACVIGGLVLGLTATPEVMVVMRWIALAVFVAQLAVPLLVCVILYLDPQDDDW